MFENRGSAELDVSECSFLDQVSVYKCDPLLRQLQNLLALFVGSISALCRFDERYKQLRLQFQLVLASRRITHELKRESSPCFAKSVHLSTKELVPRSWKAYR